MRPDYDDPIPRINGLQLGEIVDRNDPAGLGRVRVRIPGLVEPASNWAYPLGCSGGGNEDEGFFNVPSVGSEVGILFKMGDPDHPYYMPGNWGDGEVPESSDGGDPDIKVIALKEYDVVVDNRTATKGFKIVDKSDDENILEFDGVTKTLTISSTTSITIESTGQVDINGLIVNINGVPAGLGRL
jgi:hypothetical protein